MIEKKIHYCWFGKGKIPKNLEKCMKSWKKLLPDYEIIRWDETNFDINSSIWTKQAYEMKKYAFVSDYVRLKVLYENGGIYMDTDVMVKEKLDNLLKYQAFMGFENELYLTSSIIGCEKGFPLIKEFLSYYDNKKFINDDKTINNDANVIMMTEICKSHGLIINNQEQDINGMKIFPKTYFCPYDFYMNKDFTENTYTIHFFQASWLDNNKMKEVKWERSYLGKSYNRLLCVSSKLYHLLRGK